jgi:hypothetical protein
MSLENWFLDVVLSGWVVGIGLAALYSLIQKGRG